MIKNFLKNHPVHKRIVPSLDSFFLIRPTLFFSVWVMVAIGMYSAEMNFKEFPVWILEFSWGTFFLFIGLTLICASTFILNQIEDLESDKINQKLFLVGNYIDINKSISISKVLAVLGFIVSFFSNYLSALLILFIFLIWGIFYNKKPYNWKDKPMLGWISNSCIGILLYFVGWLHINSNHLGSISTFFNLNMILFMLPYIICFSSVSLLTTLPDIKGDKKVGAKTFPIAYGINVTLLLSLGMIIIAFLLAMKNKDPLGSTSIIVSLPFFIYSTFRHHDKDILRSIRYPIFILNFFTLTIYPLLFIPVVCFFYLSKYYYWHRFNLHYPTLLVEND